MVIHHVLQERVVFSDVAHQVHPRALCFPINGYGPGFQGRLEAENAREE